MKEVTGVDGRAEKPELTESRGVSGASFEELGTCRSWLALVESSGSLDIGPMMLGSESRAQVATPYHLRLGSTTSPYLLLLLESYPTVQASVLAGAPVTTVSPSEFIPV